jgi:hypothetical protein
MRRTKATLIYKQTKNLRAVQLLFGYTNGCHPKPLTKTANRGAYASTSATCVTPVILLSQLHRQQWPTTCPPCQADDRQLLIQIQSLPLTSAKASALLIVFHGRGTRPATFPMYRR